MKNHVIGLYFFHDVTICDYVIHIMDHVIL